MNAPTTREWPGLSYQDQCRLTAFKYRYKLTADGFTRRQADGLCFMKWRAQSGHYAADQGAEGEHDGRYR